MILTSNVKYAITAMIYIATNCDSKTPISLIEIAESQNISLNYLEKLFGNLRKNGVVISVQGRKGGYLLAKHSCDITIYDIVRAVESDIRILHCANKGKPCIDGHDKCAVHDFLCDLDLHVKSYLQTKSLQSICKNSYEFKSC